MRRSGIIYIYREETFIGDSMFVVNSGELLIEAEDESQLPGDSSYQTHVDTDATKNILPEIEGPIADEDLIKKSMDVETRKVDESINTNDYQKQNYQEDKVDKTRRSREVIIDHSLFETKEDKKNTEDRVLAESNKEKGNTGNENHSGNYKKRLSDDIKSGQKTESESEDEDTQTNIHVDSDSKRFFERQKLRESRSKKGKTRGGKKTGKSGKSRSKLRGTNKRTDKKSTKKVKSKKTKEKAKNDNYRERSMGANMIIELFRWFFGMDVLARLIIAAIAGIVIFGFLFAEMGILPK